LEDSISDVMWNPQTMNYEAILLRVWRGDQKGQGWQDMGYRKKV